MVNKIYIADRFGESLKDMPVSEQQKIFDYVETLAGDGWKDSHIVRSDDSEGGGLRASLTGDTRVLFSYAPEDHLIIVTGVMPGSDYELATKA